MSAAAGARFLVAAMGAGVAEGQRADDAGVVPEWSGVSVVAAEDELSAEGASCVGLAGWVGWSLGVVEAHGFGGFSALEAGVSHFLCSALWPWISSISHLRKVFPGGRGRLTRAPRRQCFGRGKGHRQSASVASSILVTW